MRKALLVGAALLLAGCLSTKEPVFDATNSLPVGEIPEFLAYVEAAEAFSGPANSPRKLVAEGARGTVVDGILVVQDKTRYYALVTIGRRPVTCMVWADRDFEKLAADWGISVVVKDTDERDREDGPVPVEADGPKQALAAYIREQFASQRLACIANRRGS